MESFVFSPDEKSFFRLQHAAIEYHPFYLQPNPYALDDLRLNKYHAFELEYNRLLWNDLWSLRLSAFREDIPGSTVEAELYPYLSGPHGYMPTEHDNLAYFEGIKLAGELHPFQWLRITPSLVYLHYGSGVDDRNLPRRSLGLEFQLGSLDTNWSLSTAFQYSDQNDLTTRLFDPHRDWDTLDMSFTFRHQLTNYLQFSLIGQRVLRDISSLEDQPLRGEKHAEHSFFFTLDFTY